MVVAPKAALGYLEKARYKLYPTSNVRIYLYSGTVNPSKMPKNLILYDMAEKYRVFAFGRPNSCNDEGELTITTPFQNYCDANGNKIECIRINAVP
jgi:hypothetical protein